MVEFPRKREPPARAACPLKANVLIEVIYHHPLGGLSMPSLILAWKVETATLPGLAGDITCWGGPRRGHLSCPRWGDALPQLLWAPSPADGSHAGGMRGRFKLPSACSGTSTEIASLCPEASHGAMTADGCRDQPAIWDFVIHPALSATDRSQLMGPV